MIMKVGIKKSVLSKVSNMNKNQIIKYMFGEWYHIKDLEN